MYGRSVADPDGHIFEIMWMDPAAAERGAEAVQDAIAAAESASQTRTSSTSGQAPTEPSADAGTVRWNGAPKA